MDVSNSKNTILAVGKLVVWLCRFNELISEIKIYILTFIDTQQSHMAAMKSILVKFWLWLI